MRPDIHAGAQQKFGRPHLVKENEWPDHLSLRGWQRPPHGKAAEIPRAGDDDYVNRVTGECFTRLRIDGRLPAHIHLLQLRDGSLPEDYNGRRITKTINVRFGVTSLVVHFK